MRSTLKAKKSKEERKNLHLLKLTLNFRILAQSKHLPIQKSV